MPDTYAQITHGIEVRVQPAFLPDQSDPAENRYVWSYHVRIANHGMHTVQLLRRTWLITDALGRTTRVHGEGVVGAQPVLRPGDTFDYTSGTPLNTPSGFMAGTYHMVREDGAPFDVAIPAFSLDSPHQDLRKH